MTRVGMFAVVMLVLAGGTVPAAAEVPNDPKRSAFWLHACQDQKEAALCSGYVYGHDFLYGALLRKKMVPVLYCYPAGITQQELQLTWVKWLQSHPEQLQQSPATTLLAALQAAFPCKN